MAKSWTPISAALAGSFVERGYGQGTGQGYTPWLDKEKVWTRRPVTSLKGWTTDRVHYLVGELARPYFFLVEWSPLVIDIREHYPLLPVEETITIAKSLGITHPVHGQTRKPVVLVSDFLLTVKKNGTCVEQSRALTSVASLEHQRTLEVLEIERRYWAARNVDWGIVTEREIPTVFASNVDFLHGHMNHDLSSYLTKEEMELLPDIIALLTNLVREEAGQPLNHLTHRCDTHFGCAPGTALTVAYHLLATRQWCIDMYVPLNPHHPLVLLNSTGE
jgi:TnsA endonuclease N terminal/TnsA endonuclease C terminal